MGAIAVISAIALGGFFMSQNALGESTRVGNENRAYQAASSGLEREMAVFTPFLWETGTSASGYTYGTTQTINNSDWIVVTVRSGDTDPSLGEGEYEMVSVGGSQSASETVSVRFQSFNLWDMNISGDEASAMGTGAGLNGNGTIIGKVYCNGDFEWTGNGSLEGGPVFVRSGVFDKQSSGSNVGFTDDRVNVYFDNPPIGQESGYYADLKGTAPKLVIPWPTQSDMDAWKSMAIADSAANLLGDGSGTDGTTRHPSSVSDSQYNVFNGDVTLSASAPFGKTGPQVTSSGAIVEAASGDVIAVGSDGTLHLNGLTYIDGALTIDSSVARYSGKGLVVAKQGVTIEGGLVPAAYNPSAGDEVSGAYTLHDRTGTKMPKTTVTDCLGIASLGDVVQSGTDWVCAAFFTEGSYSATASGAKFRGSIIAQGIDFGLPNSWLASQTGMSENLPEGLPPLNNLNAMSDWERH
jgi:hypothetical protein